jgi:hypothetical protein
LKAAPDTALRAFAHHHSILMRIAQQGSGEMVEVFVARCGGLSNAWHRDALSFVAERGEVRGVKALLSPQAFGSPVYASNPLSVVDDAFERAAMRAAETSLAVTAHLRRQIVAAEQGQNRAEEGQQQGQEQQQPHVLDPACTFHAVPVAVQHPAVPRPVQVHAPAGSCSVYDHLGDRALDKDHPMECPSCCARLQERLHTVLGLLRGPIESALGEYVYGA